MAQFSNTVENAILFLAGVCDGAHSWDGQGFSGADVQFGHSLAKKVQKYGSLTEKQFAAVIKAPKGIVHKYRKQLTKAGFDVDALLASKPVEKPAADEKTVKKTVIVKHFGFSKMAHSGKAALYAVAPGKTAWLPCSQFKDLGNGSLEVAEWLVKDKGLIVVEPEATSEQPIFRVTEGGADKVPVAETAFAAKWSEYKQSRTTHPTA